MACETAMVAKFDGTSNKVGNGSGVFFLFLCKLNLQHGYVQFTNMILLVISFFGGCMDVTGYIYCAEIFPTYMRAQGVAFSVLALFSMTLSSSKYHPIHLILSSLTKFTTVYTQAAPVAFAAVGWRYYLVFIFVPLSGIPMMLYFLPETKGLALEEIAALFGDEVAIDISHLSLGEREALNRSLIANETLPTLTEKEAVAQVENQA